MEGKIRTAAVSYRIGVQNRYSAFLDEDESFNLSNISQVERRAEQSSITGKQKSSIQQPANKTNSLPVGNKNQNSNSRSAGNTQKQDVQPQKNSRQLNLEQPSQKRNLDGKRQRANQHQQYSSTFNSSSIANKQTISNFKQQLSNANGAFENASNSTSSTRFSRNARRPFSNQEQLSSNTLSQQQAQSLNKENNEVDQRAKPRQRNPYNQRNRRPISFSAKRGASNAESDGLVSAAPLENCVQSIEEEKRRRQHKRALDLKHKDTEKREARRQQMLNVEETKTNDHSEKAQVDVGGQKNVRSRRQFGFSSESDSSSRMYRGIGGGRGRGRKFETAPSEVVNSDGSDGRQTSRQTHLNDKSQRNKNGFSSGSRGSRGFKGDDQFKFGRDSERQKPIPNFSDKLDFPSLVS